MKIPKWKFQIQIEILRRWLTGIALASLSLMTLGLIASRIWPFPTWSLVQLCTSIAFAAMAWLALAEQRRSRQAEAAFRATMAIIKGFFDSTPMRMGVVEVLDDDVRHIWDNAAAAESYGQNPIAMEDARDKLLISDPVQRELWLSQYRACLEEKGPIRFEYHEPFEDGLRWFSATVCPIAWQAGPTRRCAYVCQDITSLITARDRAEEASRTKSAFLATVSHELRTPLNAVIGFAGVLLKGKEGAHDPKSRLYLERIRDNGRNLLTLINDILDISKVEAGGLQLHLETVDLKAMLEDVVAQLEPLAREKGIAMVLRLPPVEAKWVADADKLRRIVINLTGNALKFTETGQVEIVLFLRETGSPEAIEVRDTGPGIAPDRLESIFEPFRQEDSGIARRYGGTGLGLTISRSLAESLGCDLTVHSRLGQGSVFRLELQQTMAVSQPKTHHSAADIPKES